MIKKLKKYLIFAPLILLLLALGLIANLKFWPQVKREPSVSFAPASFEGKAQFRLISLKKLVDFGETFPVVVQLRTPKTPQNKGVIGLKLALSWPESLLSLAEEDVLFSLPLPWQLGHKEVAKGVLNLEAFYLLPGDAGYLEAQKEWQTVAILTFQTHGQGRVHLTFLSEKSAIFAKSRNLNIINWDLEKAFSFNLGRQKF